MKAKGQNRTGFRLRLWLLSLVICSLSFPDPPHRPPAPDPLSILNHPLSAPRQSDFDPHPTQRAAPFLARPPEQAGTSSTVPRLHAAGTLPPRSFLVRSRQIHLTSPNWPLLRPSLSDFPSETVRSGPHLTSPASMANGSRSTPCSCQCIGLWLPRHRYHDLLHDRLLSRVDSPRESDCTIYLHAPAHVPTPHPSALSFPAPIPPPPRSLSRHRAPPSLVPTSFPAFAWGLAVIR